MSDIRITIAIPTAGTVHIAFAHSLVGLVSHVASNGIESVRGKAVGINLDIIEGSVIHANRERLALRAIENEQTHILFLDDDMNFEPQVLNYQLGRHKNIVLSNYLMKTKEKKFVAVGVDGKMVETKDESTGIEEISFSGFGCSLINMDVFRALPRPWFLPEFNAELNNGTCGYSTEDQPFFQRAREKGFKAWLDHDASKLLGHVGKHVYRWCD